jgi:hypothetical protein
MQDNGNRLGRGWLQQQVGTGKLHAAALALVIGCKLLRDQAPEFGTRPAQVLRNEHRLGARVIHRAAEQLAARFNPEGAASSIASALHGPELSSLQDMLRRAHDRANEVLVTMHQGGLAETSEPNGNLGSRATSRGACLI